MIVGCPDINDTPTLFCPKFREFHPRRKGKNVEAIKGEEEIGSANFMGIA